MKGMYVNYHVVCDKKCKETDKRIFLSLESAKEYKDGHTKLDKIATYRIKYSPTVYFAYNDDHFGGRDKMLFEKYGEAIWHRVKNNNPYLSWKIGKFTCKPSLVFLILLFKTMSTKMSLQIPKMILFEIYKLLAEYTE